MLSVVLPESLKTGDLETVDRATFRYATHYLDSKGESIRWPPEREWLEGGVDDLADAIEYLSLSERQLARGTEALEQVVRSAAGLLAEHAGEGPLARIARDLHQEAGGQTERMAVAICVSIALIVVVFGTWTANGNRFSSATRSNSRRMASDTGKPMA